MRSVTVGRDIHQSFRVCKVNLATLKVAINSQCVWHLSQLTPQSVHMHLSSLAPDSSRVSCLSRGFLGSFLMLVPMTLCLCFSCLGSSPQRCPHLERVHVLLFLIVCQRSNQTFPTLSQYITMLLDFFIVPNNSKICSIRRDPLDLPTLVNLDFMGKASVVRHDAHCTSWCTSVPSHLFHFLHRPRS